MKLNKVLDKLDRLLSQKKLTSLRVRIHALGLKIGTRVVAMKNNQRLAKAGFGYLQESEHESARYLIGIDFNDIDTDNKLKTLTIKDLNFCDTVTEVKIELHIFSKATGINYLLLSYSLLKISYMKEQASLPANTIRSFISEMPSILS